MRQGQKQKHGNCLKNNTASNRPLTNRNREDQLRRSGEKNDTDAD